MAYKRAHEEIARLVPEKVFHCHPQKFLEIVHEFSYLFYFALLLGSALSQRLLFPIT
jgi:hypothetical protein